MGIVQPWSYSRLDSFKTCPRKFHEESIVKSVKDDPSEMQLYGTRVHLAFEEHQRDGKQLPEDLVQHQPFMDELRGERAALVGVERKIGINRKLEPCGFFDADVWMRGIIDYQAELRPGHCRIVDYKTGKQHSKMAQLHLFALYAFIEGYESADVCYYWTQGRQAIPRTTLKRDRMIPILLSFKPDLMQYAEAFKTDTWQPRPNGLCRKWCGVLDCEYNGGGR